MFSKQYSGKKVLFRLTYVNENGRVIRCRDMGHKSNVKFQTLINSGVFDK